MEDLKAKYEKVLNESEIYSRKVMVTPEMAKKFLAMGNPNNRTVNKPTVRMYARSIENGKWEMIHQGIAFSKDSNGITFMIDGHTRCEAIILANIAVPMYITYNVPNSPFIDGGRSRKPNERLKMAGYGDYPNSLLAMAQMWICFSEGLNFTMAKIDPDEKYEWIIKHFCELDDIDAFNKTGKKISNRAAILCAKLSAYHNGIPSDVITKWSEILDTGVHEGGAGNTVAKFRDSILADKHYFNRSQSINVLKKAQRNIEAFYNGDILTKIYTPTKLVWDIVETVDEEEI